MPSRPPPSSAPSPESYHLRRIPRHHHFIIPIIASATFAALAIILAFILYRRLRRAQAAPTAPSPANDGAGAELRRFSYADLRSATASFSPSRRLGQGGFGPVFRGAAIGDVPGAVVGDVAVKVMDSGSLQGEREFHNELALAAKILACQDRRFVVPAIGFCSDDRRPRRSHRRWHRWWRRKASSGDGDGDLSPEIFEASASSAVPARRLMLVYELMHNGSLQDALLDRRCPELVDWGRRFAVALDVARGLEFLHCICDPPVIHGDVKPSNILLDSQLSARIADFGLARIKSVVGEDVAGDDEVIVEIGREDERNNGGNEGKLVMEGDKKESEVVGGALDDDVSVADETAERLVMGTNGMEELIAVNAESSGIVVADRVERLTEDEEDFAAAEASPRVAMEVASTSEAGGGFDRLSVDSGKETTASGSCKAGRRKSRALTGKDWWWQQDINGGGANSESGSSVKDYVMEWIRSEIKKERPKSDWSTELKSNEECLPKPVNGERKKNQCRMEWWAWLDEERRKKKKEKSRPAREWWREEFCEELTNKQKRKAIAKSKSNTEGVAEVQWWQKDEDFASPVAKRKKKKRNFSRGSRSSVDWWMDGISGEMKPTGRRSSKDWASGDIPKSGTVSSTPSMRGTVCYVAPEYGGGGPISEKCDIYSFGVLLLVIISGRRPLQVTTSPMSEFERANLISWARHLAHLGRLLDLVDPSLCGVDRDQALLCITVALLCLQRSPSRRPSIKEIVSMLSGQSEPPHLPIEFSPSPPGGFSFKSRKVR